MEIVRKMRIKCIRLKTCGAECFSVNGLSFFKLLDPHINHIKVFDFSVGDFNENRLGIL